MAVGVGIAISSIKEEEFKFSDNDIDSIDEKSLSIGFHLGFNVDVKKSSFTVKFTVVFNYDKKNDKYIQLLKFTTLTKFKVKGLKKIVNFDEENDDKFEIPDPIMVTFVGAAISSTRGMLAYKLSGTILSDYYLPLIDVQEMLKNYDDSFSGSEKDVVG
ncbi:hypothetical protein OAD49_05975 [Flavobacteriaceae bacterium]|nr:hypothetical protein [Flavobacteriaceae bacterium]